MLPLDQASEQGRGWRVHGQWPPFILKRLRQCHLETRYFVFFFLFILCKYLVSSIQRQKSEGRWHCSEFNWLTQQASLSGIFCQEVSRCYKQAPTLWSRPSVCGASCYSPGAQFWWLSLSSAIVKLPCFSCGRD